MFSLQHYSNKKFLNHKLKYKFYENINVSVSIVFKLSCFHYNLFKIVNPIVCINIIKVCIWIQKLFENINYILRMHPSLIMLYQSNP